MSSLGSWVHHAIVTYLDRVVVIPSLLSVLFSVCLCHIHLGRRGEENKIRMHDRAEKGFMGWCVYLFLYVISFFLSLSLFERTKRRILHMKVEERGEKGEV